MNIYEKIFARLEELHMSQTELSRRTGIATSTISDWRKKKINPQADKLVIICKALDISLVDLLCDEEETEKTGPIDYMPDKKQVHDIAYLSNKGRYTIFRFNNETLTFIAPRSLEKYDSVTEWDHGYIAVMTKYSHNKDLEEEYIDLVPILKNLYMDEDRFLNAIKKVEVSYD